MILGAEWLIDNGIGYLNIKSENILILEKNIKLIDYGIKFMNSDKIINSLINDVN